MSYAVVVLAPSAAAATAAATSALGWAEVASTTISTINPRVVAFYAVDDDPATLLALYQRYPGSPWSIEFRGYTEGTPETRELIRRELIEVP